MERKRDFTADFKLGNENFKIIIIIHMLWTSYRSLPLTLQHTTEKFLKKERKEPFNLYLCAFFSLTRSLLAHTKSFYFCSAFVKKKLLQFQHTLALFSSSSALLSRQFENSMIIENVQKNIFRKMSERIY